MLVISLIEGIRHPLNGLGLRAHEAVPAKKRKRPIDYLGRLKVATPEKNELWKLMRFDRNGSDLDEGMLVVVIFPVSFVAVPITFVVLVPICVIPVVVTAVIISSGRK
jgi:hypothetical protein